MKRLVVLVLLACLAVPGAYAATSPDEMLDDPVLEQRARDLGKQLRCLVCQNQSIDDSDAPLARDLRLIVREQLVAGKDEAEITAFLTARYGDFVLLRPPVRPATWGLWFGPFLVLLLAGAGIVMFVRRRRGVAAEATELSEDERRRLDALLDRPDREPAAGMRR